jgi:hypothetical protein
MTYNIDLSSWDILYFATSVKQTGFIKYVAFKKHLKKLAV